jgi:hypothetical protein
MLFDLPPSGGHDLVSESALLKKAQRLRIERQMEVEAGHLLDSRLLAPAWDMMIRHLSKQIMRAPSECRIFQLPLTPFDVLTLEDRLRELLTEFAENGPPDLPDGTTEEIIAAMDREPVEAATQ